MRVTWWNNKQINWIDEHGFLHPPWIYKFPWCLDISHDVWYVWIPMGKSYFTKPDMFGFGIPSDSHDSFQVRSQSRHHLDDGNDLPSTAISAISHYLTNILPFNPTNITLCNYIVGQKKHMMFGFPPCQWWSYPASSHRAAPPGRGEFSKHRTAVKAWPVPPTPPTSMTK